MKRTRVLVVDDEKDFGEMLKLNLESMGEYEVMAETSGVNIVRAAKSFKPDLIFLDIIMPDVDGGSALFSLQRDAQTRDIPVVFLTAIVSENETDYASSIPDGRPFLSKPVSIIKLIQYIRKYAKR